PADSCTSSQHSEGTGQRSPDFPAPEAPRAEAQKLSPRPQPAGEGRQDPDRRTEPTGGAATSRLRCAFSAGPSALPSLATVGCALSPVAAHPEDEIEDEEQDFNIDQRPASLQESSRTPALDGTAETPSLGD
ncbi:expressed sequence R74862, partial [Mus musculus]